MASVFRKWSSLVASTLVCTLALAGCSEAENGDDCNARIRMDGSAFRPHNELNQVAPVGDALGSGEVISCGSADDAEAVDTVTVHAVEGVDSQVAVVIKDGDWAGVYVAEGIPRSRWPAPLKPAS